MALCGGPFNDESEPALRCVILALSAEQAHVYAVDDASGEVRVLLSEPPDVPPPSAFPAATNDDAPLTTQVSVDAEGATGAVDAATLDDTHRIRALLWQDPFEYAFIDVRRASYQPAFDRNDRVVLQGLVPGLRQALRPVPAQSLADKTLESLPFGVGLLDAQGTLSAPNPALRRILEQGDGLLLLENGQLTARVDRDQEHLLQALLQAVENPSIDGELVVVTRSDEHPPYLVVIERFDRSKPPSTALAKIMVSDPVDQALDSVRTAARRFGLTRTETQVVHAFLSGLDIDASAAQLKLSPHTLRWYTKRIMAKTGCASRPAVLQLFSRAVLLCGSPTRGVAP